MKTIELDENITCCEVECPACNSNFFMSLMLTGNRTIKRSMTCYKCASKFEVVVKSKAIKMPYRVKINSTFILVHGLVETLTMAEKVSVLNKSAVVCVTDHGRLIETYSDGQPCGIGKPF